ncbi:hypothetical protein CLV59_101459 [Chitinophaga dinghuensis]|uniref:Uncharacterized protein n=1 Tax=Chitinophaga dinghuensis TaxID=1539050 RepID=A0A327WC48_9BACT|nr:hypothetical protein [Chitinophaga dinghuensis]RAJ87698.1 hypothetical protein CLV59_101459 [Chitinophaga dinghuensis]
MSNNQENEDVIFDPLDDLCFQSNPLSKKERFYLPLVYRFREATGRFPLCSPRKRKLHNWSRKNGKHRNGIGVHVESSMPLGLHIKQVNALYVFTELA